MPQSGPVRLQPEAENGTQAAPVHIHPGVKYASHMPAPAHFCGAQDAGGTFAVALGVGVGVGGGATDGALGVAGGGVLELETGGGALGGGGASTGAMGAGRQAVRSALANVACNHAFDIAPSLRQIGSGSIASSVRVRAVK